MSANRLRLRFMFYRWEKESLLMVEHGSPRKIRKRPDQASGPAQKHVFSGGMSAIL